MSRKKKSGMILFHVPTRKVYPTTNLADDTRIILGHGGRAFRFNQEGDGDWTAWQSGPPGWPGVMVEVGRGETRDDMLRDLIDRVVEGDEWIMGGADGSWTVGETHKPWKHLLTDE